MDSISPDPHTIRLVIIGHLGVAEDDTPYGKEVSPGGSAYACLRGASVFDPNGVGVVACVGTDYEWERLRQLRIDTGGIVTIPDTESARLITKQHEDGSRTFQCRLGAASTIRTDNYPDHYRPARQIHLATAPPSQQLEWLDHLKGIPGDRVISADMFETFTDTLAEESRAVCDRADFLFMNEYEHGKLCSSGWRPSVPVIIKHGAKGASYVDGRETYHVSTQPQQAVDTTGAGEVLAGAFLSLNRSVDPHTALYHAVRLATMSVMHFGVDSHQLKAAIRQTRDELAEWLIVQ